MANGVEANGVANGVEANGVANGVEANGVANGQASYKLAICELFHPFLHGQDETSSPTINSHFLVYTLIDLPDFYNKSYLSEENSYRRYRRAIQLLHGNPLHPTIRDYNNVATKYIRLEIIQADLLSGQEEVAYLKTFWLRIVQRRWKKIYKERQDIVRQRKQVKAIQERQRTGNWPKHLRNWPLFKLFYYIA